MGLDRVLYFVMGTLSENSMSLKLFERVYFLRAYFPNVTVIICIGRSASDASVFVASINVELY